MKHLWMYLDRKKWKSETKYRTLLLIAEAVSALAGLAVWLILRICFQISWNWIIYWIGCPVVLSWLVVFFYSCHHEFHDKENSQSHS